MVGGATRAVSLTNTDHHLEAPGPTFAGRDIFAPVAAALCNGVDLLELGEVVEPITLLPGVLPVARMEADGLHAEVLWVDRYGNAQLNIGPDDIEGLATGDGRDRISLRWGTQVRTARRAATYGDLKPGEVGLVVDSYGLLSVAMDRLSAAEQLRIQPGDGVALATPT
jgi:S-adenosylmethionine hydrolase